MKKLGSLLLMSSLFFSSMASAVEGLELGVSVIGSKTDSNGEYKADGVLLLNYDGYDYSIGVDKSLTILPTALEVSVNGKQVQVYSDAATLSMYPTEDLEVVVSALSVDYKKFNDFAIRQDEKMALVDASVTKFIPVGSIDLDLSAGLALGGYSKQEFQINDERADFRDTHFYTIDAGIGANIPVTDKFDLYVYGGAAHQRGEDTEMNTYGFEAELHGISLGESMSFVPSFKIRRTEYVTEGANIGGGDLFNNPEDTMILFEAKILF